MDLSSLLKNHQYQEVIKVTEKANDANSVSYRINAFIALNQNDLALKTLVKHLETLYQNNPLATMKLHLELLLEQKMYLEAINAQKDYENRPYISQQVEEFLRDIPNKIIKSQKANEAKNLFLDEEKVRELFLKSKDIALLTNAIYHLKGLEIKPYLSSLLILLKRDDLTDDIKTLALLILVMKKVNQDLTILKNKKTLKVNPIALKAPYQEKEYQTVMSLIMKLSKDPTIESVATNLFNQYVLNCFPSLIYNDTSKRMAVAFIALAKRYLKEENAVIDVIKENEEDASKIIPLIDLYQNKIENR